MFDVIDRASQQAEETLERQIAAHVNRSVGVSVFECEDCGEAIPEIRRTQVLGCTRCVDCQADFELIKKHYWSI
ncbi:TraR/DksA family transcriptional regulator [Xenorhabdus bovienii]|uniref:TraR/DksA family transcriptional regulator n=1 Tax=Xenorhabdus bovienii TaxID=40576 RepID=UPI0023B22081|nr:TraR/DksA family transcriptional regulator [Xenorhabdus bovienii]MDE9494201.1 TraR/DksA family transcriptional regulator [Xenorhabdus bovienii]MDE9502738.1 TraR/DksA family transcriptional regulator [Xenorhabdus bovienii]